MKKDKELIVEFVGPAGSGKTTLVKRVHKELKEKRINSLKYEDISLNKNYSGSYEYFRKIGYFLRILLKKPKMILLITPIMYSNSRLKSKIFRINLCIRSISRHEFSLENKGIILLDESSAKIVDSYVDEKNIPKKGQIKEYLKFLKINKNNYLFVFVESGINEIIKRRINRSNYADKNLIEHPIRTKKIIINRKKTILELKKILLKENIPLIVIKNNNKEDIENSIKEILKKIEKLRVKNEKN